MSSPIFGTYTSDGRSWTVVHLIKAAEQLPITDIQVSDLEEQLRRPVWSETETPWQVMGHMARIQEADLSYPILIAPDGRIMDGCHRLARAVMEGARTITAKKFPEWPE